MKECWLLKFDCVVKKALNLTSYSGGIVPVESGVYLDTKHVLSEGHGDPQGLQGGEWKKIKNK